ncbi:MAG: hypothetical protein IH991_09270 [Planctomycetes bacterium]|nr:hypothetical protein [Planctomycetota bacterium]
MRATALSTGITCRSIQSVAIFPEEFNDSIDRLGSKGELLSLSTLALVRTCLQACDEYPIRVQCDKHGGRNKYAALLQHVFPEHFVEVVQEGRAISTYRWGRRSQRVEISFVARGESFLPSALASMASKYLRELAMKAFNDFWKTHVPGLRPTAGYPVDARRFRDEIEPVRKQLEIHPRMLWRNR